MCNKLRSIFHKDLENSIDKNCGIFKMLCESADNDRIKLTVLKIENNICRIII